MLLMKITLAMDEALVEEARRVAAARGISLNQMIREELERLTRAGERQARIDEMMRLFREHPGDSRGWKWNREDLYDPAVVGST
jgi:hypothetical protein